MAYSLDSEGTLVINIDPGIAPDPYSGTSDMRSVNPSTIPNEASVSYGLDQKYQCPSLSGITGTASSATNNITFTTTTPLEVGQAIYITNAGSSGLSISQVYWISVASYSGTTCTVGLTTTYGQMGTHASLSNGTIVFSTFTLTLGIRGYITKNYTAENVDTIGNFFHWILDSNGLAWTDLVTTSGGTGITNTGSWTYAGNVGAVGPNADPAAFGNGLVYAEFPYENNAYDGYMFIFRQQQIDYVKVINEGSYVHPGSLAWEYDWNPNSAELVLALQFGETIAYPHEAIQDPQTGRILFTDGYTLGYFYQNSIGSRFDPTSGGTFTYVDSSTSATLPATDIGTCIAYNPNQTYIIGGTGNLAYIFEAFTSTQSGSPLLQGTVQIPELFTTSVVVAANNIYLFSGVRGRIYIANGSQANEYAKVPDFLSGSVQPVFGWGSAATVNNKLVFGVFYNQTQSFPTTNNKYGGVWMVDLNNGRLWCANELYSGYQDYCCALLVLKNNEYEGNGFIAGWYSPNSFTWGSSGIGQSFNNPYVDGNSWVTTELIPVGTLLNPDTPLQIEFKLSRPLVSGETITIQTGKYLDPSYASFVTHFTTNTTGIISDSTANHSGMQDQAFQWMIIRAILTSTFSNPSYCPLSQLRVVGVGEKITGYYGLQ